MSDLTDLQKKLTYDSPVELYYAERGILLSLIEKAFEDPEYETEYAHRMERFCKYCNNHLGDEGDEHALDCEHRRLKEMAR